MKKKFLVLLLLLVVSSESLQEQQPPSIPLRMKIKTLLTNAQSYLFPPNLDFRGVTKDGPTANIASETEVGAGDKVIEAVGKSLGEGKATVEETAKTAAQKLKETFSSHHEPEDL